MSKILDIIQTMHTYSKQPTYSLLLDKMPKFLYSRHEHNYGKYLIAEDDGFLSCYSYGNYGKDKAFAGREFDIHLSDGTIIKTTGQWWDSVAQFNNQSLVSVGIATQESLEKCYIFYGSNIRKEKLNEALKLINPKDGYYAFKK